MLIIRLRQILLWLVLSAAFLAPAHAVDCPSVRVRVLSRYHPMSVRVDVPESPAAVRLGMDSALPRVFASRHVIGLELPGRGLRREYRGRLRIERGDGELLLINEVPLEDYVASVVLSELGWKQPAAMRAQAVLARTWAVSHLQPQSLYDFGDLTNSQSYKGETPLHAATRERIAETAGELLFYEQQPAAVYYHGACADRGYAADEIWGGAKIPYLAPTEWPELLHASVAENHWSRQLNKADVDAVFAAAGISGHDFDYRLVVSHGQRGVSVNGRWFGIDDFRIRVNRALGWNTLRSTAFSLSVQGAMLRANGNGFGHLVGLCQKESDLLAANGWDYRRILDLFYPGTRLVPSRVSP